MLYLQVVNYTLDCFADAAQGMVRIVSCIKVSVVFDIYFLQGQKYCVLSSFVFLKLEQTDCSNLHLYMPVGQ